MRMSPLPRAIGVVLVVVGGVWVLQGIGVAQGSVMSGRAIWAVIGAALIVAGAVVLRRALNSAKAEIQAEIQAETRTELDGPPEATSPGDGRAT